LNYICHKGGPNDLKDVSEDAIYTHVKITGTQLNSTKPYTLIVFDMLIYLWENHWKPIFAKATYML